jgi:hypothetical protein
MPNYIAHFAFERPDSDLRPEDQSHGVGEIHINTDEVPTTAEDFKEIARVVFQQGDYKTVAVTKLELLDNFIDDSSTILEGTIVDE